MLEDNMFKMLLLFTVAAMQFSLYLFSSESQTFSYLNNLYFQLNFD